MRARYLFEAILVVGIGLLSLFALDGDPAALQQMKDFCDEGTWAHSARCKVLFGEYFTYGDNFSYSYIGGPLYTFLLRIAFGMGGINLVSGRLPGVLAFWGVLIALYFFFRLNGHTSKKSLLPVFVLGTNHEALIQARWGTPGFLEVFFLTLAFSLLAAGINDSFTHRKRMGILFTSGLLYSAAVATKLSACYLLWAWVVCALILVYPLKNLKLKHVISVASGAICGGLVLAVFFLFNINLFHKFVSSLVVSTFYADTRFQSFTTAMLEAGLYNSALANPMVAILVIGTLMLVGLRVLQGMERIQKRKPLLDLKTVDRVEIISYCWLFVGIATLVYLRDFRYRRYISFLVPLAVLFTKMVFELISSVNLSQKKKNPWQVLRRGYIWTALVVSVYFYAPVAERYVNEIWFAKVGRPKLEVFEWAWVYFLIAVLSLGLMIKFGERAIAIVLVATLASVNLGLSIDWLTHITFTLRDESRRLSSVIPTSTVAVGCIPWAILYETKALQLYYTKRIETNWYAFNEELPKKLIGVEKEFYIVEVGVLNSNSIDPTFMSSHCLTSKDFAGFKDSSVGDFWLAPFPGTTQYRMMFRVGRMSKVN